MNTRTLILGILLLCISQELTWQTAWANGNEVGNGGTARVCEDKQNASKSIEVYDYWEGQIITHNHLDLGPGNFEQKIQFVLDRLSKLDPYRARRLKRKAEKITSHLDDYLTDVPLYKTEDANAIYNPAYEDEKIKCYEVQFAIRLKKLRGDLKRFQILRDAWNMGVGEALEIARAGMILHEINGEDSILRERDEFRDNTRYFTFVISSDAFGQYTAETYLKLLQDSNRTSRASTLLIEGKHFLSQFLKLNGNQVVSGIQVTDPFAQMINLDFDMSSQLTDSPLMESQQLNLGEISLELPAGTRVGCVGYIDNPIQLNKPIVLNQNNVSLTDPNASMVFHAANRTLDHVYQVILYPDSKFYISGLDKDHSLPTIQLQGQDVHPFLFHPNGACARISLIAHRDRGKAYRFKTINGDVLEFNDFKNDKVLTFNEDEILEYYETNPYTEGIPSGQLKTPSDALWKDPEFTDTAFRLEVGETQIQGNENDHHRTASTGTVSLDLYPIERRDGRFLLGRYYHEGSGKLGRYSREGRAQLSGDRAILLSLAQLPWKTKDDQLHFGYEGGLIRWEDDELRGFQLLDVGSAGVAMRMYPFNNQGIRIDLDASTAIRSTAYISDHDPSRISSEWISHAQKVRGHEFTQYDIKDLITGGRDMESYLVKLNVCYRSPGRTWECNAGGFYRMERLEHRENDDLSPYNSLVNRQPNRWNGYLDMKYYFESNDEKGANNYFFVRAEVDESNLGSELQTFFDPTKSLDQIEKRSSVSTGIGWEW